MPILGTIASSIAKGISGGNEVKTIGATKYHIFAGKSCK